jgi:hypothetical protein
MGSYYPVLWVLTSNSKAKDFAKQINYGGKVFDVQRSTVNQNAINDNNYSFDVFELTQKTI